MGNKNTSNSRILSRKMVLSTHGEEIKQLLENIANKHGVTVQSATTSLAAILSHVSTLNDLDCE